MIGITSMVTYIEEGLKKIIHVNQHKIKSNRKHGKTESCITVKTYKSNDYGHEVRVNGPCKVVYSPNKPKSCGAEIYIETTAEVEVLEWKA